MSKNIYRMSEAGTCSRVLGAVRLGYEPLPETEASKRIMREGQRHEELTIQDLTDEGYVITDRQKEIVLETPILILQGHIDGVARKDGLPYLLEIKSMGRFTFQKYQTKGLGAFPEYQAQITCYEANTQLPILYVVKNRDNGELNKMILEKPPIDFSQICDKLNLVELCVQDGVLPDAEYTEDSERCRWCKFPYLCIKPEKEVKVEELPSLIEAAELFKEGKKYEEMSEERIEQAKHIFLSHAKENKLDKYQVAGVSISYSGERQKSYIDEKKLKELVSEDIWKQVYKQSKPWDDIRIRILEK